MLSSVPISVMSCLTAWLDSSWIFRICSQYRCMVPRAMDSNHRSATCSGSSKRVTEIKVTRDTPKTQYMYYMIRINHHVINWHKQAKSNFRMNDPFNVITCICTVYSKKKKWSSNLTPMFSSTTKHLFHLCKVVSHALEPLTLRGCPAWWTAPDAGVVSSGTDQPEGSKNEKIS